MCCAVVHQIVSIYAGTKGYLDDVPVPQFAAFEKGLLDTFTTINKPIYDELNQTKALSEGLEKKLQDAIANFKAGWKAPTAEAGAAKVVTTAGKQ